MSFTCGRAGGSTWNLPRQYLAGNALVFCSYRSHLFAGKSQIMRVNRWMTFKTCDQEVCFLLSQLFHLRCLLCFICIINMAFFGKGSFGLLKFGFKNWGIKYKNRGAQYHLKIGTTAISKIRIIFCIKNAGMCKNKSWSSCQVLEFSQFPGNLAAISWKYFWFW